MSHTRRLGLKGNTNLVAMKTLTTKPVTIPPKNVHSGESCLCVWQTVQKHSANVSDGRPLISFMERRICCSNRKSNIKKKPLLTFQLSMALQSNVAYKYRSLKYQSYANSGRINLCFISTSWCLLSVSDDLEDILWRNWDGQQKNPHPLRQVHKADRKRGRWGIRPASCICITHLPKWLWVLAYRGILLSLSLVLQSNYLSPKQCLYQRTAFWLWPAVLYIICWVEQCATILIFLFRQCQTNQHKTDWRALGNHWPYS